MKYGQQDTSHVFRPNQGATSTDDILLSFILPGLFWWTGFSTIAMISGVMFTLTIFRLMQKKGERKSSNQFLYEWVIVRAQSKDSSKFVKGLARSMAKQSKDQLGCYQVVDKERVRP